MIDELFSAPAPVTPTQYPEATQETVNTLNTIRAILLLLDQSDPKVAAAIAGIDAAIAYLSKIKIN